MTEEKIKHLEMIQGVITRMNSNSFQIKGWYITILSALGAIYASNPKPAFVAVGILPTVLFWAMDAYFLQQERKFRGLYQEIIKGESALIPFDMPIGRYTLGFYTFCSSFWSKTIVGLYGSLFVLIILVCFILNHTVICSLICNCH